MTQASRRQNATHAQSTTQESEESAASHERGRLGILDALELWPWAARLSAQVSLRAAGWATSSTLAAGRRVSAVIRRRESPGEVIADARDHAVDLAREALGINDLDDTVERMVTQSPSQETLRERGAELVEQSAEVGVQDGQHPAFANILEELDPDEIRVLRVLASDGDQAVVDVQSVGPLGGRPRTVARRLSMLGAKAGCRRPDRIQLYLDNLRRLSLISDDGEPLVEEQPYDVLLGNQAVNEAQEEASSGGTSRAKLVRGRIALTEFGRWFYETCLPAPPA